MRAERSFAKMTGTVGRLIETVLLGKHAVQSVMHCNITDLHLTAGRDLIGSARRQVGGRAMGEKLRLVATILGLTAAAVSPLCAATIIPVIPVAGSTKTEVLAINDDDVIAGDYFTPDGVEHGFFGTLDGNYTTFDYGEVGGGTEPRGINDAGYITGFANSSAGSPCQLVPFERDPHGMIVTVMKDGSPLNGQVQQIDNPGLFAGNYCDGDGTKIGYYGANGRYLGAISGFSHGSIAPRGVNKQGVIDGWFVPDGASNALGFVLQSGILAVVYYPDPSAVDTFLTSINKKRLATGGWDTGDFSGLNGFVLDLPRGEFVPIAIPGASYAQAFGINDAGVLAVDTDIGPFVYCLKRRGCPGEGRHVADGRSIHVPPEVFFDGSFPRRAVMPTRRQDFERAARRSHQ